MSTFEGYMQITEKLPDKDMFVDIVGVKPTGIYKQMKVFYRAKPKKEYFTDNKGKRRKRVSDVGFILQKPHKDLKIIAWKEHKELNDIVKAIYGKGDN